MRAVSFGPCFKARGLNLEVTVKETEQNVFWPKWTGAQLLQAEGGELFKHCNTW